MLDKPIWIKYINRKERKIIEARSKHTKNTSVQERGRIAE